MYRPIAEIRIHGNPQQTSTSLFIYLVNPGEQFNQVLLSVQCGGCRFSLSHLQLTPHIENISSSGLTLEV